MYKKLHLTFILTITWCLCGHRLACPVSEEELDKCVYETMFLGNPNAIVPSNEDEMNAHCSQTQSGVKCAKTYADGCMSGFPKQVTDMVLGSLTTHLDNRCNKPKDRAEFMENVKCFLPKEKMAPLHICADKHTKSMEIASKMSKSDPHLEFTCCAYQLAKQCILTNTEHICSKGHAQYWEEMFDEIASEAMTFACAEFDSLDKCSSKLKPDVWAQLKTLDEATDPAVWHHGQKTPIKFVLEMIKKFN